MKQLPITVVVIAAAVIGLGLELDQQHKRNAALTQRVEKLETMLTASAENHPADIWITPIAASLHFEPEDYVPGTLGEEALAEPGLIAYYDYTYGPYEYGVDYSYE